MRTDQSGNQGYSLLASMIASILGGSGYGGNSITNYPWGAKGRKRGNTWPGGQQMHGGGLFPQMPPTNMGGFTPTSMGGFPPTNMGGFQPTNLGGFPPVSSDMWGGLQKKRTNGYKGPGGY